MLLSLAANFGNRDFTTREGADMPQTIDFCQNVHKTLLKLCENV